MQPENRFWPFSWMTSESPSPATAPSNPSEGSFDDLIGGPMATPCSGEGFSLAPRANR